MAVHGCSAASEDSKPTIPQVKRSEECKGTRWDKFGFKWRRNDEENDDEEAGCFGPFVGVQAMGNEQEQVKRTYQEVRRVGGGRRELGGGGRPDDGAVRERDRERELRGEEKEEK